MQQAVREALWFHAAVAAVAVPLVLVAEGPLLGTGLLWLALGYTVLLPVVGLVRGHAEWLWLWLFLLPLGIAQLFPDWALAEIGRTLTFPDLGARRLGGIVPLYLAGLWMLLLFPLVLFANATRRPYFNVAVMATAAFVLLEWLAPQVGLWRHVGVTTVLGVATYPLIPEVLLAITTLWAYRGLRSAGFAARFFGAAAVSVFYAGALFLALLVLERAGSWLA